MVNDKNARSIERISALIEEQALSKEQLLNYLRQMMEIRAFENNVNTLLGKAVIKGASHLCAGEEAVSVGVIGAWKIMT